MRHFALALTLVSALAVGCASTGAAPQPEPTMDEMMAAMMRAGTPGPEHRALDAFVGTWNATVTYWMSPDAPPEVSRGVMTNTWVLDGHHLSQQFSGDMGGMPFTGIGTWGYDVAAGKYHGTWQDSMSTALMVSYGPPSKDGKTFEMLGTNTDPMTGEPAVADEVITINNPNRHTMEMFENRGGKRVKTMEIVYDRVK